MPPESTTPPGERQEASQTRHISLNLPRLQGTEDTPFQSTTPPGNWGQAPEPATPTGDRGHTLLIHQASRKLRTCPQNLPCLQGTHKPPRTCQAYPNSLRLQGIEDKPSELPCLQGTEDKPTEPATPPGDQGQAPWNPPRLQGISTLRSQPCSKGPTTRPPNPPHLHGNDEKPPKPATPPRTCHISRGPRTRPPNIRRLQGIEDKPPEHTPPPGHRGQFPGNRDASRGPKTRIQTRHTPGERGYAPRNPPRLQGTKDASPGSPRLRGTETCSPNPPHLQEAWHAPEPATPPRDREAPNLPCLQETEKPTKPATPPGDGEAPQTRHASGDWGQVSQTRNVSRGPRRSPVNPQRIQGTEDTSPNLATPPADRWHPRTCHFPRSKDTPSEHTTPPGGWRHNPQTCNASRGPTRIPNLPRPKGAKDMPPKPTSLQGTKDKLPKPATPPGVLGHAPNPPHFQGADEKSPNPPRLPEPATLAEDQGHALQIYHASRGPRTKTPEPATPPGDRGQAPRTNHTSRGPDTPRTCHAPTGAKTLP